MSGIGPEPACPTIMVARRELGENRTRDGVPARQRARQPMTHTGCSPTQRVANRGATTFHLGGEGVLGLILSIGGPLSLLLLRLGRFGIASCCDGHQFDRHTVTPEAVDFLFGQAPDRSPINRLSSRSSAGSPRQRGLIIAAVDALLLDQPAAVEFHAEIVIEAHGVERPGVP